MKTIKQIRQLNAIELSSIKGGGDTNTGPVNGGADGIFGRGTESALASFQH